MLRVVQKVGSALQFATRQTLQRSALAATCVRSKHGGVQETDEEYDNRYVNYFSQADGWQVRKAMNDLNGSDLIPEPKIVVAAMKACRRLNDYALAVRYLESVKNKCAAAKELWPYMLQEIQPALTDIGILTPAEMGYDKPELAIKDVYSM